MRTNAAFTLIEILVTVILVGIMAAVVIPVFRDHSDEARTTAEETNLSILQSQVDAYHASKGHYPNSLADLMNSDPPYVRSIPGGLAGWAYAADTGRVTRAE